MGGAPATLSLLLPSRSCYPFAATTLSLLQAFRCCKPFAATTLSLLQAFALQALTAWVRAIRLCLRPYLSIYIYLSIYLYLYILYITYTYVCSRDGEIGRIGS